MPFVWILPWLALGAWVIVAQSRFYRAYVERYGGPDRHERMRMFMTRPDEYVGLLRKPPFKWSSMFRPVDDPVVERRRKQYVLAGLAAIGYLFVSFLGVILYAALFVW